MAALPPTQPKMPSNGSFHERESACVSPSVIGDLMKPQPRTNGNYKQFRQELRQFQRDLTKSQQPKSVCLVILSPKIEEGGMYSQSYSNLAISMSSKNKKQTNCKQADFQPQTMIIHDLHPSKSQKRNQLKKKTKKRRSKKKVKYAQVKPEKKLSCSQSDLISMDEVAACMSPGVVAGNAAPPKIKPMRDLSSERKPLEEVQNSKSDVSVGAKDEAKGKQCRPRRRPDILDEPYLPFYF
eukprot:CAMPEP_0197036230 /NCGR_PEP_ID=MMETSP1384-20130603/13807_1 /TAXON_ID=29189 /ORGANISM="Ammonia sp." /LENGTH=238 /DNA_ID=CAMNT_0042466389 /DNA_START=36 /DNA_END=752 /DNA_ORIENTATION=+